MAYPEAYPEAYLDGLSGRLIRLIRKFAYPGDGFRYVLAVLAYSAYPWVISGLSGFSGPYPDFFCVDFFCSM